jgi:hypothetical protein
MGRETGDEIVQDRPAITEGHSPGAIRTPGPRTIRVGERGEGPERNEVSHRIRVRSTRNGHVMAYQRCGRPASPTGEPAGGPSRDEADGRPALSAVQRPAFMVECWAVYDHVDIREIVRQPILLNTEGLERVESLYRLRVF